MDSAYLSVQLVFPLNVDNHHSQHLKNTKIKAIIEKRIFNDLLIGNLGCFSLFLPSFSYVRYSSGSKPYFLAAARRSSSFVGNGPGLKSLFQSLGKMIKRDKGRQDQKILKFKKFQLSDFVS